jgi:hypothetical protein
METITFSFIILWFFLQFACSGSPKQVMVAWGDCTLCAGQPSVSVGIAQIRRRKMVELASSHSSQFKQLCRSVCTELGATISSVEVGDATIPYNEVPSTRLLGLAQKLRQFVVRIVTGRQSR